MKNRLKDKIIIVTGGNGLLGKAIIERIKEEGAFCINFEINHKTNDDLSNVSVYPQIAYNSLIIPHVLYRKQ